MRRQAEDATPRCGAAIRSGLPPNRPGDVLGFRLGSRGRTLGFLLSGGMDDHGSKLTLGGTSPISASVSCCWGVRSQVCFLPFGPLQDEMERGPTDPRKTRVETGATELLIDCGEVVEAAAGKERRRETCRSVKSRRPGAVAHILQHTSTSGSCRFLDGVERQTKRSQDLTPSGSRPSESLVTDYSARLCMPLLTGGTEYQATRGGTEGWIIGRLNRNRLELPWPKERGRKRGVVVGFRFWFLLWFWDAESPVPSFRVPAMRRCGIVSQRRATIGRKRATENGTPVDWSSPHWRMTHHV